MITTTPKTETPTIYIRPSRGWIGLNLKDLWAYRELVYFLIWRDIKVRYKQAFLGVGWAALQPLMTMIIFTVIFGKLANLPPDAGIPASWYPVFSFAGVLPWQLFQGALSRSSISLVGNSNLLTKVYFPRLIIPFAAVSAGVVDFGISFLIMIGLMLFYQVPFSLKILVLPVLVIFALLTALAVGLWLAALNVQYRDIQQMVPFVLNAWMYASPVAYSIDIINVSPIWKLVYGLNPMAGIIQGFRWALIGSEPPTGLMAVSLVVMVALLISGLYYFRRMERHFADTV
jgi:lipopolysaccharide transport system permease protein